jgi:hypothetical protein
VPLTPAAPLAGPIPAGGNKLVQATLAAVPPAGTKVRLHISPGDTQPANDNSLPFTVVVPVPDLQAVSVTGNQAASGYMLSGNIRNNGPGIYTGGRSFVFQRQVAGGWTPLAASQAVTGPILVNGTRTVSVTVPGTLPEGTVVRLHLTPGDAVSGNDNVQATMHAPDLQALNASVTQLALKGTIKNNGPGTYINGRRFWFEKKVGPNNWTAVTNPNTPIPGGPLAPGGTRTVNGVLTTLLPPGTQVRLHVSPGDANTGNDASPVVTVVTPDLQAMSVTGNQAASGYLLRGNIRNNGPGIYTGGRSFVFQKKVGAVWVTLAASQAVTGPILVNGTRTVSVTVPGTLPEGTVVRLHLTAGDAVPGNDNLQATMHAPDLQALNASVAGLNLNGTIKNNGPGTYVNGRTFWFEKKVGANWVALTNPPATIPGGPLAPGGTRTVTRPLSAPLPAGTQVRLRLSGGDANSSNNVSSP